MSSYLYHMALLDTVADSEIGLNVTQFIQQNTFHLKAFRPARFLLMKP